MLHSLSSFQKNKRTAIKLRFNAPVMRIFHSTNKDTQGSSTKKSSQTDAEIKERRPRYRRSIDTLSLQSYRDLKPNKFLEDIDKTWRSAQELLKPSPLAQETLHTHSDNHTAKSLHNLGGIGKLTDPDIDDELSLQKDLDFFQESLINANEFNEKKSSSDEKADSVRGPEESKGRIESIFFASSKQKEEPGSLIGPKRNSSQMHLEGKNAKSASSDSLMSVDSNKRRVSLKKTSMDPILRGTLKNARMNSNIVSTESIKARARKGFLSRKTISIKEQKESSNSNGTFIIQTLDKIDLNPNFCYWDFDAMGNYLRYFQNGNCRVVLGKMRLKAEVFHGRSSSPLGGMSPALKRKKLRQSIKQLNWLQE